jgi:hypothetical protein
VSQNNAAANYRRDSKEPKAQWTYSCKRLKGSKIFKTVLNDDFYIEMQSYAKF